MKKGDIFSWSYQPWVYEERRDSVQAGTLYWCTAQKAIFDGERLRDIYWSYLNDGRSWSEQEAEKELELSYLGNKDDLEPVDHPEYYNDEDIINLTHPNSFGRQIYKRINSQRSRRKMLNLAMCKLEDTLARIEFLQREIEYLEQNMLEIKNTPNLEKVHV